MNVLPLFMSEMMSYYSKIGAIFPTLTPAAKAMCSELRAGSEKSRSILEVGAGTGPITKEIAKTMTLKDELVVCELNESFLNHLRAEFASNFHLEAIADLTSFVCDSVENIEGTDRFDVVVSSLPLSAFGPDQLRSIFAAYQRLLKPGGSLTYIEYAYLRTIFFSWLPKSSERRQTHELLEDILAKYQYRQRTVLANVPLLSGSGA